MFLLQTKASLVLVAEPAKQLGEGELNTLSFLLIPGRRAEEVSASGGIHRLHLLYANNQGQIVATSLDLGRGHEHGHAARGASCLVARGRDAGQGRVELRQKRAQVPLLAVQLSSEVANVRNLDLLGVDASSRKPCGHRFV